MLNVAEETMDQLKDLVIRKILNNAKGPEAIARLAATLRDTMTAR